MAQWDFGQNFLDRFIVEFKCFLAAELPGGVAEYPVELGMADGQLQKNGERFPSGIRSICECWKDASICVPAPGFDLISSLPLQASAASFSKGMPSPTLRVVRLVKNGSVTFRTVSSSMPRPSSSILAVNVCLQVFAYADRNGVCPSGDAVFC